MTSTVTDSWVTVGPSGYYSEACVWFGLAKSGQVLVVKFSKWNEWYNKARFSNARVVPPAPAFCGDTYEIANQVRDELNQSAEQLTTNGKAGQK
jgi:hypothetical protein